MSKTIDEARIREAELDRDVRLKELEYELEAMRMQIRATKRSRPPKGLFLLIWAGLIIALVLIMGHGAEIGNTVLEYGTLFILFILAIVTPFVVKHIFKSEG